MTTAADQLRALMQPAPQDRAAAFRALLASGNAQPVQDASGAMVAMQPPRVEVQEAQSAELSQPAPAPDRLAIPQIPGEGPFVDAINNYVIGNPETAGDATRAIVSGLTRGTVSLADLPGNVTDALLRGVGRGVQRGTEAIMGENAPAWTEQLPDVMAGTNVFAPSGPGTLEQAVRTSGVGEAAMDYQPQTTLGEYSQTIGEFLPGAALAGGGGGLASTLARYGLAPAVASEAAGQLTEGTAIEPYARGAAAIGTTLLTGRPSGNVRPLTPRADPEMARQAETLIQSGVRPTVGQVTGSGVLRRLEGSVGEVAGQADDLTAAALRTTGSAATRATPEALARASDDIVQVMDDAVRGVDVPGTPAIAQQVDDIVSRYIEFSAQSDVIPAIGNIASRIQAAANGGAIPAATLNQWRSNIRNLLTSNHGPTREAAFELRNVLDDAVIAQLNASGRADDVARLLTGREQYRNWLAIADASTRAGAETGVVSPTQLQQAVIRTQGRRNVAVGNTTPLGELSRSGASVLRPESTVRAGGVRELPSVFTGAGLGAAAGAQMMPQAPLTGAALGMMGGAGAVNVGQAGMRSRAVQNLLMDPRNQIVRALLAGGLGSEANR